MSNEELKAKVIEWALKMGRDEVVLRIQKRKFSSRTAELLADGKYKSSPKGSLRDALIKEMKKDGILLSNAS